MIYSHYYARSRARVRVVLILWCIIMARKPLKNKFLIQMQILMFIKSGYSVRSSLEYLKLSENTFYRWLKEDCNFKDKYLNARRGQEDFYFKKINKLITKPQNKKRKTQIDELKWRFGRMKLRKYKIFN